MDASSFMDMALAQAEAAAARGEVPVGAVIVERAGGRVVARAGNRVEETGDPTAHAEMLAIREAAPGLADNPLGRALSGHDLYVTLEPCPMCAQAIALAHIGRLYYGAVDPKGGGIEQGPRIFAQPTCHHRPEIYPGIGEKRAAALLRNFFGKLR
ncbi:MAG: nucleoside deaminase [Alphaproteobacteria bacterium]